MAMAEMTSGGLPTRGHRMDAFQFIGERRRSAKYSGFRSTQSSSDLLAGAQTLQTQECFLHKHTFCKAREMVSLAPALNQSG